MPQALIPGFRCYRCGHSWAPLQAESKPNVCPKCKSPYWDKPRKENLGATGYVTTKWKAGQLHGKSVEFTLHRAGHVFRGFGFFSVTERMDNLSEIRIVIPPTQKDDASNFIVLSQAEADHIESHTLSRKFLFRCVH
jgi:DNA-directed RNA polymerase subunit RPC12/RpoP